MSTKVLSPLLPKIKLDFVRVKLSSHYEISRSLMLFFLCHGIMSDLIFYRTFNCGIKKRTKAFSLIAWRPSRGSLAKCIPYASTNGAMEEWSKDRLDKNRIGEKWSRSFFHHSYFSPCCLGFREHGGKRRLLREKKEPMGEAVSLIFQQIFR